MSGMPFLNNSIFTGPVIGFNSNPESPMIPGLFPSDSFFLISSPGPIFGMSEGLLGPFDQTRSRDMHHGINILIRLKFSMSIQIKFRTVNKR